MGFFDDMPSVAGELMPSLPSMPSDFLPNLPSMPSFGELMPSLPNIGELMPSLPSDFLPSMPSLPNIGEFMPSLPSDFLPNLPSMPEIGEIMPALPSLSDWSGVGKVDQADVNAAGTTEAERGMSRYRAGLNTVGMGDPDSINGIFGENGPLFSGLAGDENLQKFSREHDVQAAMAERASGGGAMYTAANVITAGVGAGGSLLFGSDTGSSAANSVWEALGYPTGNYAQVQGTVENRR